MKLLEQLGFRNADEMDIHIALVSVRTSWIVLIIALLVWSLNDLIVWGELSLPFILLSLGLAIYFITILTMRSKLGNGK